MVEQLKFNMPNIDGKATKEIVEKELDWAAYYNRFKFVRKEMKQTPSYAPRFHGETNAIGRPAEDAAIWNADREREYEEHLATIMTAVKCLKAEEQDVIMRRYFENGGAYDYQVYNSLGWSERQYYRIKAKAFYNVAFALGLEVYRKPSRVEKSS